MTRFARSAPVRVFVKKRYERRRLNFECLCLPDAETHGIKWRCGKCNRGRIVPEKWFRCRVCGYQVSEVLYLYDLKPGRANRET